MIKSQEETQGQVFKDQILTEEHHRRARSIGGTESRGNVSYVEGKYHKDWHTLFGNMNAFQICNHINNIEYKPKEFYVICKFINGIQVKGSGKNFSKNRNKIAKAWKDLFKNLEFSHIIDYINNVWLDPSYHFYLEKV